ncbi:MAG: hypothetical protein ABWZ78_01260 [Burkholderiaceae bacterium]
MESNDLEADYVVVGAGAVGMAFVDTLLTDTDATMIVVDRHHRPGGHWNDAYPFVRLHAPSALYGVNSRPLGSGRIEHGGPNRGLLELASGAEILDYYDRLMRERLLPSGRVSYLPLSDYRGGQVVSRLDGRRRQLHARRRIVDATVADTRVPATHPPAFDVADGVTCIAPGGLVDLDRATEDFVIIGAGKTAMDTAVWLLERGVDPDAITWIRPHDPWLLNRAFYQTDQASFEATVGALALELEAASTASDVDDLFERLEARAVLRRIDRNVVPTRYRCAIVSDAELAQMRRIRRVVRLGRVAAIRRGVIVLERGVIPVGPNAIHIHCSTDGIPRSRVQPVFQSGRIVMQYVRRCSPTFSAALIAHLEATIDDDAAKNTLCGVVPVPQVPTDWLRMLMQDAQNAARWNRLPPLRDWLVGARLNAIGAMIDQARRAPTPATMAILERYQKAAGPALARLEQLLAQSQLAPVPA